MLQVFHEPRLIDRLDRPETHRYRRELPEFRHQPGVGIGRQAFAIDLLAKMLQLRFTEATLEKSSSIDTGRRVPLHKDQVSAIFSIGPTPEMVETDVIQCRSRGVTGNMATQFATDFVGANHHGQGVPAYQ